MTWHTYYKIINLFRLRNVFAVILSLIGLIALWSYVTGDALAFDWFDWDVGGGTKFLFAIAFLVACGMCLVWFGTMIDALDDAPLFNRIVMGVIPFLLVLISSFLITSSVRVVKSQMWHGHALIDKVMEVEAR